MVGVGFRLEAELLPFFLSRFEVEGDSRALLVRELGGGRGNIVQSFRYGRLPRCHAYNMG